MRIFELTNPMTIAVGNALFAIYENLKASPKPRHRPLSTESAFLRFAIVEHVEREFARSKKLKNIIADLPKRYHVSRSHVYAAIKSVDPDLRATIRSHAIADAELERRLTPT